MSHQNEGACLQVIDFPLVTVGTDLYKEIDVIYENHRTGALGQGNNPK